MRKTLLVLALSAFAAFGADVSGKWSGSFVMTLDGETRDDTAYMVLTQDGGKVTGTVGPNVDRQFPIKSGTIEGSKIKLEVVPTNGPALMVFNLTVDGDKLTGDAAGEGEGRKMTAKLDLKREK